MIPIQFALRRRMMINANKELPISDLPLGTLIRIADSDGGSGVANYEIADINNLVSGGVVLVRKDIYSTSEFGTTGLYPNSTLDNLITDTIYNKIPQKLRDKMMEVTFNLLDSGDITRKMFVPTKTMAGFGNNDGVAEGKALQLYGITANTRKTFNGTISEWWLSSGYKQYASSTDFEFAWRTSNDISEDYYEYDRPSKIFGVVPAFVIPSETPYNATPNTDGSYNLFYNTPISDLPPIGTPLSDWTWEQIVELANSGKNPQNYFSVGDEKDLILTTGEVVPVVIGDFYHNTITGTSTKAPIAFTFKNCLNTSYSMNGDDNTNSNWNDSTMRNTRMPAILNTFPVELITDGAIKYVDVLASAGNGSMSLVTSSDRLRLHSLAELGFNDSSAASGEGTKYAYYTSGNRIKTVGGANSTYWTRSPNIYETNSFCCVSASGSAYFDDDRYSNGVACGFDI